MQMFIRVAVLVLAVLPTAGWCLDITYDLAVRINPEKKELMGQGSIRSLTPVELALSTAGLADIRINDRPVTPDGAHKITIRLAAAEQARITYRAVFKKGLGFMDTENIFLTGRWYPQPEQLVRYNLAATLPAGFIAVSEAEAVSTIAHPGGTTFQFDFKRPLDALHLAASKNFTVVKDHHEGIAIEAYFFQEDASLAEAYINYSKHYLSLYNRMLTPYPYKRFAIVENILPTGYSMPTFTLLGREVVRLPFIVRTSLGHEILHQWFGNSVYIDRSHGNWAEGLTQYLADHHYADLDHRGADFRRQMLINYQAYVNPDNTMPASRFVSRANRAQAAIGYGKVAMIFHMLRQRFQDGLFFKSLRELIQKKSFQTAAWHDIRQAFETTTGDNLEAFFKQWLQRSDIPDLAVEDTKLTFDRGQLKLRFNLLQSNEPYQLAVPVTLKTAETETTRMISVTTSPQAVSLTLASPPTAIFIDGDYTLMRTLNRAERPPVLADILGSPGILVVAAKKQRPRYTALVKGLGIKEATWVAPDDVTFAQMKAETVLVAGFDNPLVDLLLGGLETPTDGIRLKIYKNPYAPAKRLLIVHAGGSRESEAVARKLVHYGKYTELAFNAGRNTHKATQAAEKGIPVLSRPEPVVLRPDKKETLADLFPELRASRVIFVGEQHDRFSHHLNQLRVIQALQTAGEKIGVGMEMFQAPYQPVIDAYLAGEIDERTFLKRSDYYERWRYDYNLYKPILDFLKANRIPLVALNLPGDISRKTARDGIEGLTQKQREQVPGQMDFSDEHYREDLKQVFNLHGSETDLNEFNYFYQAQTLWDETMAASAAQFLKAHPDRKLVVLAGNGHLRYKYGIPQRLYRRSGQPFAVILQDDEIENGIADYVLLTTEIEGVRAPKLGVMVTEEDKSLLVKNVIEQGPAGKAGLQSGDVITALAGSRIDSLADLKIALFYTRLGDRIHLVVDRAGETLEMEVELKAHPRHISRAKP